LTQATASAIIRAIPRAPPTAPPIIPATGSDETEVAAGAPLVLAVAVMLAGTGEPLEGLVCHTEFVVGGGEEEELCERVGELVVMYAEDELTADELGVAVSAFVATSKLLSVLSHLSY